ncbi:MAG: long-chain fatty acid--CoA ligase [Proteobacteria bacterium]|nr:long-chain fatty acid--CoA ligase [Pseudomonadota bacterium]MBU1740161.1 long-chain fatty acid--CoA ligase [Pseudomonadota bacterium]
MLVHEILENTAARLPDKPALVEGEATLTYAETRTRVRALAARLQEMGVGPGDRVALLFPNCLEFCLAYFAALTIGAVVVPLNNRLAPREFEYIVNDCGAETLILGHQFWETWLAFKDGLHETPRLIYAGDEPKPGADIFYNLTAPGPEPGAVSGLDLNAPACIMYTSGTTGLPKGAVMSHGNVLANARNCGAHLNYLERDTTLIVVPLFHVTGLNSQLVAFFYTGGTCAIMRAYNTAEMIRLIERHRVTVMFNVPTMYVLMLVSEALDRTDLSTLRLCAYGGAPMDPETIVTLQRRLGVNLYNAYGLTETSSLTTVLPACDAVRKAGSVGLPVSGVRLRVVDDAGRDLPPDLPGELLIKGPNVVKSYWNKSEATAQNIRDDWLFTGDVARIDAEGFVYIADRKKDMIVRGGENVYSIEVESALVAHPAVLEAAVVPRPHSIFGEAVHAFVVLAPGRTADEDDVIAHCRGLIADYKAPASVSFVDELPRNPGGKVLKNTLRDMVPPGDPPRR